MKLTKSEWVAVVLVLIAIGLAVFALAGCSSSASQGEPAVSALPASIGPTVCVTLAPSGFKEWPSSGYQSDATGLRVYEWQNEQNTRALYWPGQYYAVRYGKCR